MRNHRLISLAVLAPIAIAGCFGGGPVPAKPADATVVYAAPVPLGNVCSDSLYIGPMAIGADSGFVVTLPYQPASSNCSPDGTQTGSGPQISLTVNVFPKDGSDPAGAPLPDGSAGLSDGTGPGGEPVIASDGANVAFAYAMGSIVLGPRQTQVELANPGTNGTLVALGLALDGTTLYGASATQTGGDDDPFSPTWPCGSCGSGIATAGGELFSVALPLMGANVVPTPISGATGLSFACGELKQCLIGNSTSLFFMTTGSAGTLANIASVTKPSGPVDATFDAIPAAVPGGLAQIAPVGFAANDALIAWAVANQPSLNDATQLAPGCWIWSRDPSSTTPATLVFQSTTFSCLDVALASDGSHIYFTIVATASSTGCNGCDLPVRGEGIGRITADGATFESIAIDLQGLFDGPRRVFIDGSSPGGDVMFVVDPLAIATIPITALDNQHAFTP